MKIPKMRSSLLIIFCVAVCLAVSAVETSGAEPLAELSALVLAKGDDGWLPPSPVRGIGI